MIYLCVVPVESQILYRHDPLLAKYFLFHCGFPCNIKSVLLCNEMKGIVAGCVWVHMMLIPGQMQEEKGHFALLCCTILLFVDAGP